MVEFEIGQMEAGKKVQRLVRQMLPGVPLSGIYKMVRTGRVKLNGKRAKADEVVQLGDVIRLYMADADYAEVSKKEKKFVVVTIHPETHQKVRVPDVIRNELGHAASSES